MIAAALVAVHVQLIIPSGHNLQHLAFWVALGAGHFRDENIDVDLAIPDTPGETRALVDRPGAQAAVLPPPMYLDLIGDRAAWRLVANLMQNDGIDLVVRRSVAEARKLSASQPLGARLRALKGLKLGVAPGPRSRLAALFSSVGLKVEEAVEPVILTGDEQNEAFAQKRVDLLFAHTPFLERALVDQDAVMLVNQSAGEVPSLAARQIHALCVSAAFADKSPDVVRRMVRAIARAEKLIRSDPDATVRAVLKSQPRLDEKRVRKIVEIYRPAIPATPAVSVDGLRRALALYPAGKVAPTLPADLGRYVLPAFAAEAMR
jgi:ABC-type nitrate/sulfonate/bicarbonate transport system substrate-binding protein